MGIWVLSTTNQLFARGSYTETKFPKKKKIVTGKTPFFVVHFVVTLLFVLTLASDVAVLHGNDALSVLVLSSKK